ncbi:unnamed protein product, partial [marine sediment metagenome]
GLNSPFDTWEDIITYTDIGRYPNQTTTGYAWGTYTANATNMDQINTTYYWSIYAEDSHGNSIEKIYHFKTRKSLYVTDPSPPDGAMDVPLNPLLQVTINDAEGNSLDWRIMTNASGEWDVLDNGTLLDGNGTVSVIPTEMKLLDTRYWWSVNITDGEEWVNYTYRFTANTELQFNIKWQSNIGDIWRASLVDDLNGDGIKDVVQTCNGVVALNGVNGSVLWRYNDSD